MIKWKLFSAVDAAKLEISRFMLSKFECKSAKKSLYFACDMCVTRMIKHRTLPCWPALHHSGECRSCARAHNYSPGTLAIMFRPKYTKSARFWTVLKCRELAITLRVVARHSHIQFWVISSRIHERNIEFILIKAAETHDDSFTFSFVFAFDSEPSYISLRRSATAVESQPYVSETLRGQKETLQDQSAQQQVKAKDNFGKGITCRL